MIRRSMMIALATTLSLTVPAVGSDEPAQLSTPSFQATTAPAAQQAHPAHDADPFEADRRAILAMAGCFRVTFNFEETVAIASGYTFGEPHQSHAIEWVQVIHDSPRHIELQHVLLVGERVVKHWRQAWHYEHTELLEYQGNNHWQRREISEADVAGTWTQTVYQVDDSPRYASFGRWRHDNGLTYWESESTWRPLPRREWTQRNDYDVLVAVNRHTITPAGWVHEQDNRKLVLNEHGQPSHILAIERGINHYERCEVELGDTARRWWEENQAYWHDVRTVWSEQYASHDTIALASSVDGQPLHRAMARLNRELVNDGDVYDSAHVRSRILEVIQRYRTNAVE